MMTEGDGREGQPAESVVSLESLASAMDEGDTALANAEEGEESEQAEGEEVEQEEAEEGEESEEEATFTVKVNGKDVTLTQTELIEQAQKGFDYTQKTMAVAEERKAAEAERSKAAELRQQHEQALSEQINRLQAVEKFMQAQLGDPPPIEWAQQDAAFYLAQKQLYEDRKGQLGQASEAIQELQHEQQRQRQAWIVERAESTEKALRDTLPGWNDDVMADYFKYAGGLGLNPQTVDTAFLEPGMWQLIHKAKQFDDLMAKKAELKPVAQLPKVAKPGNSNQPQQLARRQEAMRKHKANPSLQSLADLI
jgi:hypothetical protein